jgi:hypothetical protein
MCTRASIRSAARFQRIAGKRVPNNGLPAHQRGRATSFIYVHVATKQKTFELHTFFQEFTKILSIASLLSSNVFRVHLAFLFCLLAHGTFNFQT